MAAPESVHGPQARLSEARQDVAGSLAEIARELQGLTDVRGWVDRYPLAMVAGAAALGFLLSSRPRALSSLLQRLIPALTVALAKPWLEEAGRALGASTVGRAQA